MLAPSGGALAQSRRYSAQANPLPLSRGPLKSMASHTPSWRINQVGPASRSPPSVRSPFHNVWSEAPVHHPDSSTIRSFLGVVACPATPSTLPPGVPLLTTGGDGRGRALDEGASWPGQSPASHRHQTRQLPRPPNRSRGLILVRACFSAEFWWCRRHPIDSFCGVSSDTRRKGQSSTAKRSEGEGRWGGGRVGTRGQERAWRSGHPAHPWGIIDASCLFTSTCPWCSRGQDGPTGRSTDSWKARTDVDRRSMTCTRPFVVQIESKFFPDRLLTGSRAFSRLAFACYAPLQPAEQNRPVAAAGDGRNTPMELICTLHT